MWRIWRQLLAAHRGSPGSTPSVQELAGSEPRHTELVVGGFTMSVALAAALLGPVLVLAGGALAGHYLWRHRQHTRT